LEIQDGRKENLVLSAIVNDEVTYGKLIFFFLLSVYGRA
jgi:hypothetical protein